MVAGAGAAGLVKVVAMLVGMVAIWRSNRARRRGEDVPEDSEIARRQAERAESERRMRSYLASRDQRSWRDDDA
jgi:hypothetical protein